MTSQSEFEAAQTAHEKQVNEFQSFLAKAFLAKALSKGTVDLPDTEQPEESDNPKGA